MRFESTFARKEGEHGAERMRAEISGKQGCCFVDWIRRSRSQEKTSSLWPFSSTRRRRKKVSQSGNAFSLAFDWDANFFETKKLFVDFRCKKNNWGFFWFVQKCLQTRCDSSRKNRCWFAGEKKLITKRTVQILDIWGVLKFNLQFTFQGIADSIVRTSKMPRIYSDLLVNGMFL